MKNYILTIASIFIIAYMIGSFVDASFILTDWEQSTRNHLGVFIGIAIASSSVLITAFNDINKNK
jgi:hypothetical protein